MITRRRALLRRVYVFSLSVLGIAALVFSLASAFAWGSRRWLVLLLLQLGSSFLRAGDLDPGGDQSVDTDRLVQLDRTLSHFFTISGLLAYSPSVAAVIAAAELSPAHADLFQVGRDDRRIDWFRLGLPAAIVLATSWLFVWLIGETPPLDAAQLAARPVPVLSALALCASLTAALRSFLPALRLGPSGENGSSASPGWALWTIGPSLLAAALAGSGFLVFQGDYLLSVVLAAPAVLIVYIRNRTSKQRISTLIESRDFLQSSLDGLASHIAVLDQSGRVLTANQAWRTAEQRNRLFGPLFGADCDYPSVCRAIPRERIAAASELARGIEGVMRGETPSVAMTYNCQPAAPDAWYIARVSRLPTENILRVIVSHQDISDQKLSEARLRASEARYRKFFEDDLTGDFVADGEGVLLDCNPAFARILGMDSPEKTVGRNFFSTFAQAGEAEKVLEDLRRDGRLEYREMALRSTEGRSLHVVANLSGNFDDRDWLSGIKGYLFDDTERKKLEAEILHSQKMEAVGQLAGGIAHDFNNILMVATGYGEFLRESLQHHLNLAKEAVTLLQAAKQAARLTSKLLAFSRRQLVKPALLDLNRTVEEMTLMLRPMIGEHIEVSTKLAGRDCMIRIDSSQLEQLILDLAVNSRDAMPTGGRLELETSLLPGVREPGKPDAAPGWVLLRVRDTGLGMAAEVLSRVFEPFFTTKQKSRGTGLGLSTAYGIVQQCGGRIEILSRPGEGTAVEVYFPEIEAVAAQDVPRAVPARRGVRTILVAEDQNQIRRLIRGVLVSAGYQVLEARDGIEAAELAQSVSAKIDLLLTDLIMPRMGGWELAERLRVQERHEGLKVLFMTGYAGGRQAIEEAVAAGRETCLSKPFASETLLAAVSEILDADHSHRE